MIYDPFSLENLKYDWESERGEERSGEPSERRVELSRSKAQWWDKAYYDACLEIAKLARSPILAVVTVIRNRWKRSKGQPFSFGNVTMSGMGFDDMAKARALKQLEVAGFIKVERRLKKSPLITVLKMF
jgi:hypothetical protein